MNESRPSSRGIWILGILTAFLLLIGLAPLGLLILADKAGLPLIHEQNKLPAFFILFAGFVVGLPTVLFRIKKHSGLRIGLSVVLVLALLNLAGWVSLLRAIGH